MKFIIKILLIANCLLLTAYFSFSQNLVQNGSLEKYSECPYGMGQLDFAKAWFTPRGGGGSSEYYHVCATINNLTVPSHGNGQGFQYAKYGNAYCGYGMFVPNSSNREYAATSLSYKLESNKQYCVSFFVSLANFTGYGIEDIGVYLSNDTVKYEHILADTIVPQILNTNGILFDTLNWMEISGTYIAKGGEKFITIGNFNIHRPTNFLKVYATGGDYSYYYVDNVSVYPCNAPVYAAVCGNDTTICLGDSFKLGNHKLEQYEYFWFALGNEKDTLSKSAMPYFSPDTTTTYVLKLLDFKFDKTYDTITVNVIDCREPTSLLVYPNPTNDIVNFKFNSPIPELLKIELYDVIGRKIRSTNFQQNYEIKEVQMNLFDLASGMYFYRVLIGNESKFVGKIVKVE